VGPWDKGFGRQTRAGVQLSSAIDYGIKRNILRLLAGSGCKITVVPATTSAEDILAMKPDGVFSVQRPPAIPPATGKICGAGYYEGDRGRARPTFGICLGHQMLGLAVGRQDEKRCIRAITAPTIRSRTRPTGKVEITLDETTGFAVDQATLPKGRDPKPMSRCSTAPIGGIQLEGKPVFFRAVPPRRASPRPHANSHYLFKRFYRLDAGEQARLRATLRKSKRADTKLPAILFLATSRS